MPLSVKTLTLVWAHLALKWYKMNLLGALIWVLFDGDQNHYPTSSSSEQFYFGCYIQNLFRIQGVSPNNPIKCPHWTLFIEVSFLAIMK